MTSIRRFGRFNLVGVIGIGVQIAALSLLTTLGVHYVAATAMAVSLAVVHNFWWHRRWTGPTKITPAEAYWPLFSGSRWRTDWYRRSATCC